MQFHSETEEEDGCHHMRSLALLAEARAYLFAEVAGLGLLRDRAASEAWETDDVEQGSEIEVSGDPEEQETACLDFHQDLERDFDERAHSEPQSDLVLAPDPGPENLERPLIDLSDEPLQADPGIFNEHEDERVQYPWIYGQSFPNQPFVPQQRYSTQQPPIFSLDSPEDDPNPFDQAAVEQARTEELQNLASRLSESQRENETLRRQISELESKIAGLEALNGAKERSRKRKLEASFKGLDALKEIGKEVRSLLLACYKLAN